VSILDSLINAGMTAYTNYENKKMMYEAWAREDSAYQRKAKDLEAAGLNPILAASGPGAGSSPAVRAEAPKANIEALGAATELMRMKDQFATSEAQRGLLARQSEELRASTEGKDYDNQVKAAYGLSQAAAALEHTKGKTAESDALMRKAEKGIELASQEYEFNKKFQDQMARAGLTLTNTRTANIAEQTQASQLRRGIDTGIYDYNMKWYKGERLPYGGSAGGPTGMFYSGKNAIFDFLFPKR
jgi:hypothetical protein